MGNNFSRNKRARKASTPVTPVVDTQPPQPLEPLPMPGLILENAAPQSPEDSPQDQVEVIREGPEGRQIVFVVGLGMVGIAFIEKMLNLDEKNKYFLVTCGEERHFAYNRVGLTEYFEHRNVESLYLNPPSWYAQHEPHRLSYHLGETVTSISPDRHLVHTDKNRAFHYDKCIIATGSRAEVPPYTSLEQAHKTKGVFVYRNISDLDSIIAYAEAPEVKHAVVVGGGLLGLEAAKAAFDLESISRVSIINRQGFPLSRQLDAEAGEMVLHKIEAMGVEVLTHCSPTRQLTRVVDGKEVFYGFELQNGKVHEADLVIYAIGIRPRDDVARASGINCHSRGGIIVGDDLSTSAEDVYAVGECASWRENTYGLIGPGIEMADILSFNLTQTEGHAPRAMNAPDLSTKLKLMGIDVASFGDFFADNRYPKGRTQNVTAADAVHPNGSAKGNGAAKLEIAFEEEGKKPPAEGATKAIDAVKANGSAAKRTKKGGAGAQPINCLVYKDPFSATYKKYIFTEDGKHLLGGMMVGDVSDFVKLVAIVKKKKALDVPPSQFIVGDKKGNDDGGDLDDDAQVCSCHNVLKGDIVKCVQNGDCSTIPELKAKTKVGTGCGGCMPLVTSLFNAEMKKAGRTLETSICPHFKMSRTDLFNVIKVKQLKTLPEVMAAVGVNKDSLGCELCKPAIGSILSSLYNEHVMRPLHHQNQDTNDKFLANIQRNGTFSVVPRIAAGEISPDGLIVIGQVAKKYGLYTKITGGQRIDMFGARKDDLPSIWEELCDAGFESGHAYGKSLRTVKSCVGSTWCRYGVGDSVGLAVQLENRYRGVRSPHKFKGGVSGCVRECAEAQGKDFGLIATDKGWNIFVGGNGGANPRHAELFAKDVPPSKVVRVLDRFLAYYITTADKLERTARWVEKMDGGIEKLRRVILDDELGICKDLDALMDNLINTYEDEWAAAIKDPSKRRQFKQFINTDERLPSSEMISERGQARPADWAKSYPPVKLSADQCTTPKAEWTWVSLAKKADLVVSGEGTSSAAVKYGDTQLAVYHVPRRGYYATQQMCPHKRAFVLDHGIIGDTVDGKPYVSCPLHKRNFALGDGECLNDGDYKIMSFEARESPEDPEQVQVLLPPASDLDAHLGTDKWLVRQAESQALGLNAATQVSILGPRGEFLEGAEPSTCGGGDGCGDHKLSW